MRTQFDKNGTNFYFSNNTHKLDVAYYYQHTCKRQQNPELPIYYYITYKGYELAS